MELTLYTIIDVLKRSGINSKQIVANALENATTEELMMLRESITERININRAQNKV